MKRINQNEEEQIEFVIARFPVHKEKQSFLPYNIYFQSQQHGIQQSVVFRLPCVREGCTTACYFQAQSLNKQNKNETCLVCGNSSISKLYLDIGLKHFINKHRKYITLNTPLNVLINPHINQYYFSAKTIKNDLESTLSSFIAEQLIKQMKLSQSPLLGQSCLDMYRINKEIKPIFKPPLISKPYYVYSFCKYHPILQQKCSSNYLVLFIKNIQKPVRVKLLTQQGKQICDNSIYLKYAKIILLGNINTFIFCIPNKYTTEYYVSNCNYHLQLEQKVLVIIHQKSWKDELPRLNGSLIADQINNCVFAIGGFDSRKNDSLDYISCFLNCRWQIENNELFFLAQIQKNHHLFTNGNNKSIMKSSYCKEKSSISKFAIVKTSYLINSNPSHRYNNQNKQSKYGFLSIGGAIKDSIFFGTNKFLSKPPGIRTIIYDKAWELNPVIHHTFNSQFYFIKNNYIIIELPHTKILTQKSQLQQFLVLGGSKGLQKQQKGNLVYLMDHLNLQQPRIISSNFHFGQLLTDNIDQNSALLFDDHSKEYYVRTTIPFAQPIYLETNIYAHCLIIEFHLSSGCIRYRPGVLSYFNNRTQIQPQSNELLSKN